MVRILGICTDTLVTDELLTWEAVCAWGWLLVVMCDTRTPSLTCSLWSTFEHCRVLSKSIEQICCLFIIIMVYSPVMYCNEKELGSLYFKTWTRSEVYSSLAHLRSKKSRPTSQQVAITPKRYSFNFHSFFVVMAFVSSDGHSVSLFSGCLRIYTGSWCISRHHCVSLRIWQLVRVLQHKSFFKINLSQTHLAAHDGENSFVRISLNKMCPSTFPFHNYC